MYRRLTCNSYSTSLSDDDFSIFPNHVPNVVRSIDFIFYPSASVQSDHVTAGAMAAQCRIYDGSLCVGGDEGR